MKALVAFFLAHQTTITVGAFWLFSALCSTMPPLKPDAGYFTTWAHDLLQAIAANLNKKSSSTTTIVTPEASIQKTQTEGPGPVSIGGGITTPR